MLKDRNPEEWLKWVKNLEQAAKEQNITTGPAKFARAKRLLDSRALITFKNAATLFTSKTNETFKQVIKSVTEHVFLKSACHKQKSYMRRFLEKPRDLNAKQFVERVIHINKLLERFPDPSSTTAAAKMPENKILDILEESMPHVWQKHMRLQRLKTLESSINEFIDLCKGLELTKNASAKEGVDNSANQEGQSRSKRACTTENKKQGKSDNNAKDKFLCMLHGPNPTHNTKNFCNLKKHVEKVEKENPRWNDPHKTQEEINAVFNYVQKKMVGKRKPRPQAACLQKRTQQVFQHVPWAKGCDGHGV